MKKLILILFSILLITGCSSIPMASIEEDTKTKNFNPPSKGMSGIYIYRNSFIGQALKKELKINDEKIGRSANKVYFYKEVTPGEHELSTKSEFGYKKINFTAVSGEKYFFRQYIKMGVFSGSSDIKAVSEEKGKKAIQKCSLALSDN